MERVGLGPDLHHPCPPALPAQRPGCKPRSSASHGRLPALLTYHVDGAEARAERMKQGTSKKCQRAILKEERKRKKRRKGGQRGRMGRQSERRTNEEEMRIRRKNERRCRAKQQEVGNLCKRGKHQSRIV